MYAMDRKNPTEYLDQPSEISVVGLTRTDGVWRDYEGSIRHEREMGRIVDWEISVAEPYDEV